MTRQKHSLMSLCSRLSLGVLLFTPACSYYGKQDGEKLAQAIQALQTQASATQQKLSELESAAKRHDEAVAKLDHDVTQLTSIKGRNDADLGVQLEQAREAIARVRGQVESFQERLSTVESDVKKAQDELDLRFQKLQEQSQLEASKNQAEKEQAEAERQKNERLFASPTALFAEVDKLIADSRAGDARKLLREFTIRAKADKNLEKSLPDAQYYLGETYYAEQNWQQAAAEYNAVRKNYAKSTRVPDALYKLGMCFEKLKLPDDAKLFYQTIVEKYPKSSVAKSAKARLAELK